MVRVYLGREQITDNFRTVDLLRGSGNEVVRFSRIFIVGSNLKIKWPDLYSTVRYSSL